MRALNGFVFGVMNKRFLSSGTARLTWGLLASLPVLTGCPHNDYVIELRPVEPGLERRLICSRQEKETNGTIRYLEFPTNELAGISVGYPKAPTVSNLVITFTSTFSGQLPPDLDGWGQFICHTSRLGTACCYVERFRGSTNLVGQATARLAAMDEVADYLSGWFKRELGRHKGFPRLQQRLNVDLRRDMKELNLQCFIKGEISEADVMIACVERGYLATFPTDFESPGFWGQIRSFVRTGLGEDASRPEAGALSFLKDGAAATLSFSNYLATTPQYKRSYKQWKAEGAKGERPDAGKLVEKALERGFEGSNLLPEGNDHLVVRLRLPEKPEDSNGEWNEAAKEVTWEFPLPERGGEYQNPCASALATWSVANRIEQERCFGKVVLTGAPLIKYCQWYGALSPAQQTEWDAMLDRLRPEDRTAMKGFRFRDEGAGTTGSLTDYARSLFEGDNSAERKPR